MKFLERLNLNGMNIMVIPNWKRLPRKKKKILKKKYKNRYDIDWLKCNDLIVEYVCFFRNPFNWNMNEQLWKIKKVKDEKDYKKYRRIS